MNKTNFGEVKVCLKDNNGNNGKVNPSTDSSLNPSQASATLKDKIIPRTAESVTQELKWRGA